MSAVAIACELRSRGAAESFDLKPSAPCPLDVEVAGSDVALTPRGSSRGLLLRNRSDVVSRQPDQLVFTTDGAHVGIERLELTERGVEQSWTFVQRPPRVEISLLTNATLTREDEGGLVLDVGGGAQVRYGHGTWVDARGVRTPVRARFDRGIIALVVPQSVVETSAYPAILDPLISTVITLDAMPATAVLSTARYPNVAFSGGVYLAVWNDHRNVIDPRVRGTRVSRSGQILDPNGIFISPQEPVGSFPMIAGGVPGFLVVHLSESATFRDVVWATRIDPNGVVLDPSGIRLSPTNVDASDPDVVWAGSQWVVVWSEPSGIMVTRLAADGTVLDATPQVAVVAAFPLPSRPRVIRGPNGALLSWLRQGVETRTLSAQGVLGAPQQWIADTSINHDIAWNGSAFLLTNTIRNSIVSFRTLVQRFNAGGGAIDPTGVIVGNFQQNGSGHNFWLDATAAGSSWFVTYEGWTSGTSGDVEGVWVDSAGNRTAVSVAATAANELYGRTASDGTSAIVVWGGFSSAQALAVRVSSAGAVLDSPPLSLVTTSGVTTSGPALSTDGLDFLAAWSDSADGGPSRVRARRLAANGQFLDVTPLSVGDGVSPVVAFNGVEWLVVAEASGALAGWRVSRQGAVLDAMPIAVAASASGRVSISAFGGGWLVAFTNGGRVQAVRVDGSGAVVDAVPFVVTDGGPGEGWPAVGYNGSEAVVAFSQGSSVYAVRVHPDGGVLDPTPARAGGGSFAAQDTTVAWGGGAWLVAWADGPAAGTGDVEFGRFDRQLQPLDVTLRYFSSELGRQDQPSVAWTGVQFAGVWRDQRRADSELYGARLNDDAGVRDALGLLLGSGLGADSPVLAVNDAGLGVLAWRAGDRVRARFVGDWEDVGDAGVPSLGEPLVRVPAETVDAGGVDAGPPDAGRPDGGAPDAGAPDAGRPDGGSPDAGVPDGGQPDAGAPDAGAPDAGAPDAGAPDAGAPDAGAPDAGRPDAGRADAGATDGGTGEVPRGGCGCSGSGVQALPLAVFAMLLRLRRREVKRAPRSSKPLAAPCRPSGAEATRGSSAPSRRARRSCSATSSRRR